MRKYIYTTSIHVLLSFIFFGKMSCKENKKTEKLEQKKTTLISLDNKKTENKPTKQHQSGDIIFQISRSGQGKAIQIATKSPYTHCGILYELDKNFFVYEAIQPVTFTPLDVWIARGENRPNKQTRFVTKRLKNAHKIMTKETLKNMQKNAQKYNGKNYDIWFSWSDDNIYCSELVWKIYKETTKLEIGKCQKLKDFDLSHPEVKRIMTQRYGANIPLNETVISPANIFESELLETVFDD